MEDRPKARPSVRRRPTAAKAAAMPAASSPSVSPRSAFNMCGHDGCGTGSCNVRYVGPVSHLRDHHALHAARGVAHVWTAAIVSGLAVVLTGVLAYNAAQAATANRLPAGGAAAATSDMRMMMQRMDRMEAMMRNVAERCGAGMEQGEVMGDGQEARDTNNQGQNNRRLLPPPPFKSATPTNP